MKRAFKTLMTALLICSAISSYAKAESQKSEFNTTDPTQPFGEVPNFEYKIFKPMTDEFESKTVDYSKWKNSKEIGYWGTWTWLDENVRIEDGKLCLDTKFQEHKRDGKNLYFNKLDNAKGKKFFFTSGIVISKAVLRYGYYEAKIKNCDIDKGVCPAFWLQATGYDKNGQKVGGAEIDILELPETASLYKTHIETNLHSHPDFNNNGNTKDDYKVTVRRKYKHGWDTHNEDYHIYGCLATPEYIAFYIDGKLVYTDPINEKMTIPGKVDTEPYKTKAAWVKDYATPEYAIPNVHWTVPMNLKLSSGIRAPYRMSKGDPLDGWEGTTMWPVEETSVRDKDLFPVTMQIEYVRAWTIKGFEE